MSSNSAIRQRELQHIAQTIKDDLIYNRKLDTLYQQTGADLAQTITADVNSFAGRETVSMIEAKRKISQTQVKSYHNMLTKASDSVKTARDEGQYITPDDYLPTVNGELRRYNVTTRTSRLELLQAKVNAATVVLAAAEIYMLAGKLFRVTVSEFARQSEILGTVTPSAKTMAEIFRTVVLPGIEGITFSDNIWTNQAELRDLLNQGIQRTLLRGESPLVSARTLTHLVKDEVKKKAYAARRIAVTETARAQTIVQKVSYEENGYTHYIFVAETDDRTCAICEDLDGQVFLVADMTIGENASPIHPSCRCSTSAHTVR